MVLNTIHSKHCCGGVTCYELQKEAEGIPNSKVYRMVRQLEEAGYLEKVKERTGSRPKHLFSLSEAGLLHLDELKEYLRNFFKKLEDYFQEYIEKSFDINAFLHEAVLFGRHHDGLMIKRVLDHDNLSKDEKMALLNEIEEDLENMMKFIKSAKEELTRS
ncbi:MAG: PadR family transcriptional regulator [Promethearchaeota archaeon]